MSNSDKENDKTSIKDNDQEKVVINLDEIISIDKGELSEVYTESLKRIGEAARRSIVSRTSLINSVDRMNLTAQHLYKTINANNIKRITAIMGNIADLNKSFDGLSEVILASQRSLIHQLSESINQIGYSIAFENISDTLSILQKNISTTMIESISSNLERISEIDFSDVILSEEDFIKAIDVIKDDAFEDNLNKELTSYKDVSKIPVYIKRVIFIICAFISFVSDSINVWNFIDETIQPLSQEYFVQKEKGVFHTDKAGISWLNDELNLEISDQLRSSFRIVEKDGLIVREGQKKDSRIAGTLDTGYIVQIIEKSRNWTYIMYSDPDEDVVIEGWTNTRYLKRITE